MRKLVFIFIISLSLSWLLTFLMQHVALKNRILSWPGRRKIHTKPVPYLGGIAIYLTFLVATVVVLYTNQQFKIQFFHKLKGLLTGGIIIVALGLWDDIRDIRPIIKFIGQVAVALLLFAYGFRVDILTNPFFADNIQLPLFLSILITVMWIVGLVNAMNFIDGLDGLAAGMTFIICGALSLVSLYLGNHINVFLLTVLAGCVLGFLFFNFPPAKIFMGDSGSMFIGLVLASVALIGLQHKSATAVVLLVPVTVLGIPIYDIFMAVIRRTLKKKSIFKADKKHLHHRLLNTGLKQKEIVLFMCLITLYLGVFSFLFVLIPEKYAFILLILLALGLFMGTKTIVFIEKRAKVIRRLKLKSQK
ncbi:MAG: undecaprenyl/decaprenyl-phosphate alpha-N-acetylglucosaminyl 1-phosphate transferase [Candidatus Omnitrophica bacterium]|nr:undecaprenyl/decaprenyl-phosphate alpha-N-acetylglucosaminyl 1-phosphate transferase [Candidatus Omnitrophota bacterium]